MTPGELPARVSAPWPSATCSTAWWGVVVPRAWRGSWASARD